jgi:hypothetical protein
VLFYDSYNNLNSYSVISYYHNSYDKILFLTARLFKPPCCFMIAIIF